jgi:hypothetical protein
MSNITTNPKPNIIPLRKTDGGILYLMICEPEIKPDRFEAINSVFKDKGVPIILMSADIIDTDCVDTELLIEALKYSQPVNQDYEHERKMDKLGKAMETNRIMTEDLRQWGMDRLKDLQRHRP